MIWNWLIELSVLSYGLIVIALSFRILMKRRPVGVTLSWLLFLYVLPVFGILFYLLFGERHLGRLRAKRAKKQFNYYSHWLERILVSQQAATNLNPVLRPVMELTRGSLGMPALSANQWTLFSDSPRVFSQLIEDINSATEAVLLEFYILESNGDVEPVLTALESAVKRNVQVSVLLDSVGSNKFLRCQQCRRLKRNGVDIVEALHANYFRMLFQRQDLRQHRKLIAIDNRVAYTGSMNLVDPAYFKKRSGVGPWVDIMVRLEGDIAKIIQGTMIFDWEMETGHRREDLLDWPSFHEHNSQQLMQLLPSGPALDEEILLQVLLTAIHNANDQIVITTPYFVPDEALLQALKSSAKRGLAVTVLVPRRNDSKLAQFAGRSFYDELISAGVKIRRFNGGLLHSKTVVIDDHLVLIGSVNLDMRSIWLNFEATLVVDEKAFCRDVLNIIDSYEKDSHQLLLSEWRKRPIWKRALENVAQLASPLL